MRRWLRLTRRRPRPREQQGLTNVSLNLILTGSGVPPDTSAQLGRYEAIANQYLKMANGGQTPTSTSAQTAADAKLASAECHAAKNLDISVNPQYGQLDYGQYSVVSAPNPVFRSGGPTASASPVTTAPLADNPGHQSPGGAWPAQLAGLAALRSAAAVLAPPRHPALPALDEAGISFRVAAQPPAQSDDPGTVGMAGRAGR